MKNILFAFLLILIISHVYAQQPRVYGFEVFSNDFTDYEDVKYLSVTNIGAVPVKIKKFKNLEHVFFSGNDWDYSFHLPDEFYTLRNLKSITIYNCDLKEISPEIKNFVNLESLVFYGGALNALPEEIALLKNLEVLEIDSRCLQTDLPATADFKSLKKLNIASDVLPAINSLQKLHYSNINKSNIPQTVAGMQNLRTLIVNYGCNIFYPYEEGQVDTTVRGKSSFWEEEFKRIGQIQKLDTLMLYELNYALSTPYSHLLKNASVIIITNVLEGYLEKWKKALPGVKIEENFSGYESIQYIMGSVIAFPSQRPELLYYASQEQLPGNDEIMESEVLKLFNVKTIPAFVYKMPHIKDIYISSSLEGEFILNDSFYTLTKIEKLNISGAKISGLDGRINQLKKLKTLYINNPFSSALPVVVTELVNLRSLTFISDCKKVELPESIVAMPNLKTFSTNASSIPPLKNLETLILLSNSNEALDIDLSKFKMLQSLVLEYSATCGDENNKINDDDFWKKEFNTLAKAPQNMELILIGLNWEMAQNHAQKLKNIKSIILVDPNGELDAEAWQKLLPQVKFEN